MASRVLAPSADVTHPNVTSASRPSLQRKCACGNHTLGGALCSKCSRKQNLGLQTKLTINEPGDIYEQEADRIADQVTAAPAHHALIGTLPRIQRYSRQSNGQMDTVPASVGEALASPGRPLEPALQQDMEQRFGQDFSRVRVHSGAAAEQSARDVNAHAYTVRHNFVFGAGQFSPETQEGRRLIAHELTHVVQQGGQEPRQIFRQACAHDAPKSSKCGVLETTGEEFMQIGNDRVVATAMNKQLPGTWLAQVYSPPNLAKGGLKFGLIDAVKVTTSSDLTLDVAEIKSRNTSEGTGGCMLATTEAKGYVDALTPIAPRMAAISKGLGKEGGVSIPDCRSPNKDARTKLVTAGVNLDDSSDMSAWCVLNSIQKKLGRTFVKGFDSVLIKLATDGNAGDNYMALLLPISCGKGKQGFNQMFRPPDLRDYVLTSLFVKAPLGAIDFR